MHAAFSYDRRVGSVATDPYTRLPLDPAAAQDASIVAGANVNNNDHVSLAEYATFNLIGGKINDGGEMHAELQTAG